MQIESRPIVQTHRAKITLAQAYEGIHVFGGTGSGKTSSMKFAAINVLKLGLGGIVLCDKPEESANWREYAEKSKREDDFFFLSQHQFNFLDYEATRLGGGDTENITNIFMEIVDGHKVHEDFWIKATRQLIRNSVDLLVQGQETLSLKNIQRVVSEAPRSKKEAGEISTIWFGRLLKIAKTNAHCDYEIMRNFWVNDFTQLASDTRSSIIQTFTAISDKLARGKIGQIFNSETTFKFDSLRNGKILVCDLSNKEYGETGKFCNILIKYMFQKMVERQHSETTPAFIWADEAQYFISKNDINFLQTARSSRIVNVFMTQNINNYYAELGGSGQATSLVKALLGNFQTKIFCQNTDLETNQYAANLLGKVLQERYSESMNKTQIQTSSGVTQARDYLIQPSKFDSLQKGGETFDFKVGLVLYNPSFRGRYVYTLVNQKTGRTSSPGMRLESETDKANYPWTFYCIYILGYMAILLWLCWLTNYFSRFLAIIN